MKIAICDDEKIYIEKIKSIVESFFSSKNIDCSIECFSCGEDLVAFDDVFDIVFLDIEMKSLNGIETARYLNNKSNHTKIFIFTSHNQYLDAAMDLNVFRYIDKNSNTERIVAGIQKALENLQLCDIVITTKDNENIIVSKNDIIYVEVKYKKVYVQTVKDKYVTRQKMEYFKERLETGYFAVPHNSFIVNMNHIKNFKRESLLLTGGHSISVASRKQASFKKQFMAFIGEGYGYISSDN